jgi:hypothetical protein
MIGERVAFRGAFGPHAGIILEETEDSVILKVEKNDTLGNRGRVMIWKCPPPFETKRESSRNAGGTTCGGITRCIRVGNRPQKSHVRAMAQEIEK